MRPLIFVAGLVVGMVGLLAAELASDVRAYQQGRFYE
jgi:hypothetical protein